MPVYEHRGMDGRTSEKERTYAEEREPEPEDEQRLVCEVPGPIGEHDVERERLDDVEEAEDGPVGDPLGIVMRRGRLDGFQGEVGRGGPADEVGDRCAGGLEVVEENERTDTAEGNVCLGDGRALLKAREGGPLFELGSVVSVWVVAQEQSAGTFMSSLSM